MASECAALRLVTDSDSVTTNVTAGMISLYWFTLINKRLYCEMKVQTVIGRRSVACWFLLWQKGRSSRKIITQCVQMNDMLMIVSACQVCRSICFHYSAWKNGKAAVWKCNNLLVNAYLLISSLVLIRGILRQSLYNKSLEGFLFNDTHYYNDIQHALSGSILNNSNAVLTIPTWIMRRSKWLPIPR